MTNSNEAIRQIYEETRAFYQERIPKLGQQAHGFRILYGPPAHRSPVLFIGYQPGGDAGHIVESHHLGWPDESEYAVQDWKLAKRVRQIWNATVIKRSTGLNAIFFRAPSAADWRQVPLALRREMEQFSHDRVQSLIKMLAPEQIVFLGMGAMARFIGSSSEALKSDGRVLVRKGNLSGVPAYGVIHLSGAHLRANHLSKIREFFGGAAL